MLALPTAQDAISVLASDEVAIINALVLDDCLFDRTRIRRLLSKLGMIVNVEEVESVSALERVLDSKRFDVVFIDYNLVESDGFDALEILRKKTEHASTACIMIAGDDQSEVAVNALKKGCSDYIPKHGLTSERLRSSVLAALENHMESESSDVSLTGDIDRLANEIAARYSNALQPEIAGILRQVRTLRASWFKQNVDVHEQMQAMEERCMTLWSVLKSPDKLNESI